MMTSEDFVRGFLGLFPDENFNEVGGLLTCLLRGLRKV